MPPKGKGGGKGRKGQGYNHEAFSGLKKKEQLQKKRAKKREADKADSGSDESGQASESLELGFADKREDTATLAVVTSFGGAAAGDQARLSSLFARQDDEAVAARRQRGLEPLQMPTGVGNSLISAESVLASPADVNADRRSLFLPHPVRPAWSQGISPAKLEMKEEAYFQEWCESILASMQDRGCRSADISPFELNLEVWRQLWRVVEQSDIVVLIADVRNPAFHIPPTLVQEVIVRHGKRLIILLSKCDLVSQGHVQKWKRYLSHVLPDVKIVEFSSRPAGDPPGGELGAGGVAARKRWLSRRCRQADMNTHLNSMAASLLASITGQSPVRSCASQKETTGTSDSDSDGSDSDSDRKEVDAGVETNNDEDRPCCGQGPAGALAIGMVGHPNVGKTSVLNALAGRKAASVSSTAGHTKHLQHIRVLESLHPNAYVIDCPGLVFPSLHQRADAELNGLLPLAQTRETMSAIRILAEALPLSRTLALKVPEWYEDGEPWSPVMICEAYAEKHNYVIPRSGAPDVHRAGLEILKDAKDGAILLAYEPPPLSDFS
eukprot:TRINITY_DN21106_c0_g1_i2.p1 TRINITY_DN21106_c0_g1~~TRINITY_DN21106_c0_g1_i2.p1  ORF type:complete len:552 (+),score=68.72 TRINITY_DN21106_c0_g1_i2:310-1965(+)